MPNANRFALWFRLAGRPLPTLLLAAQGLTLPPAAAQEGASDPPAAVLRVARDQPRLDTPQSTLRPQASTSSRRTTPAPTTPAPTTPAPTTSASTLSAPAPTLNAPARTLNAPALTAPQTTSPTVASDAAELTEIAIVGSALKAAAEPARQTALAGGPAAEHLAGSPAVAAADDDGWVRRGMIRRLPVEATEESAASIASRPSEESAKPPRLNSIRLNPTSAPEAPAPEAPTREEPADEPSSSDSSNSRALALQEQLERFEAVEPEAASTAEAEPQFVEIIPESIEPAAPEIAAPDIAAPETEAPEIAAPETTAPETEAPEIEAVEPRAQQAAPRRSTARPPETGERMPLRDPVIPGLTAGRAAESARVAERRSEAESSRATEPNAAGDDRQQAPPAAVVSAAALRLKRPIEQALQYYHQRPENAATRTPWGMLHAILPYELDANIDAGRRRYNAIAWLAGNNPCRNQKLLSLTSSGRIEARTGIGLQGHQAQLLAIFAQVGVPRDYPLYVGPQRFTVADLVQAEMAACRDGEELTFTLIGLSHYLPTDAAWTASDGERWDFERLLREELRQPVVGAACGGTHRLMGLNYALAQRRREGAPLTGQWERAAIFIDDFVAYSWQLQNRDGSFSTNWFEGREDNGLLDRKVQTSGHILEWLIFNASDEQLQDERMVRGITFLTQSMLANRGHEWQVGPKGHALRALSLYHRRVFESEQPWRGSRTAAGAPNDRR